MKPARWGPAHLLLATALALAGCQQERSAEPTAGPSSEAPPEAKPGIVVRDGVLVLPAVKGNPGAAYFTVTNGGPAAASLAAVWIEGAAKAEMHESDGGAMARLPALDLPPGRTERFERGGKHVMVFDLGAGLKAGGSTEMTLTFAGGDKVSIPLRIESAGGAGAMAGMGHGEPR